MEPKLKEKLTKIAVATLRNLKVGKVKVTLEMMARLTQLPVASNARILAPKDMRRRMVNARIWEPAVEEICREWMADFMAATLRKEKAASSKVEISAARERQLALFPGFERLPTRFRSGKSYLKFPDAPVSEFISYAESYSRRAQRDQATAVELMSLALRVEPFADGDLTVAQAFERAQWHSQPSTLAVVPRVG